MIPNAPEKQVKYAFNEENLREKESPRNEGRYSAILDLVGSEVIVKAGRSTYHGILKSVDDYQWAVIVNVVNLNGRLIRSRNIVKLSEISSFSDVKDITDISKDGDNNATD